MHPLVRIKVGAVRLLPSPRYFPLHLRLIRCDAGMHATDMNLADEEPPVGEPPDETGILAAAV